ncbi:MAG: DNA polymerase domain-containing protein [archaeon]
MIYDFIDVFEHEQKAIVWLRDGGKNIFLKHELKPRFYFKTTKELTQTIVLELKKRGAICFPYIGREFATGEFIETTTVEAQQYSQLHNFIKIVNSMSDFTADLFNSDISFQQRYVFEYKLAPFSKVWVESSGDKIVSISQQVNDSFDSVFPKLKTLEIEASIVGASSLLRCNDIYFRGTEKEVIKQFVDYYRKEDADVVVTHGGDKYLVEYLLQAASKNNIHLNFGRFTDTFSNEQGKSYFTYGRVIRKQPKKIFKGRLHFDAEAFVYQEGGLEGTFELAKTTYMPLQLAIRKSPGTSISNLQMFFAYKNGFLIPAKKNHYEKFKTALKLLEVDKGGFSYTPIIGLHENVVELDFSSLYPSIMVLHNISPETVLCDCCKDNIVVPEAGYNICNKKVGLVPLAIKGVLEKRLYFKHMKNSTSGEVKAKYASMSNALKWLSYKFWLYRLQERKVR